MSPKSPSETHSWNWTAQKWTGNDRPYQNIRNEIDKALDNGKNAKQLIEQQKGVAEQHPNNPQCQYAWAYTAYRSLPPWAGSYAKLKQKPAGEALARLPATDCYNYSRLRFLLTMGYDTFDLRQVEVNARSAENLGRRLLQNHPSDLDVKYHLIDVDETILGRNPTDLTIKKRALYYSQEMIAAKPSHSNYRTLPASVYVTCWSQTNDPADARAAIASYRDYLRVAPPDEAFRAQAERLIKLLQDSLAKQ